MYPSDQTMDGRDQKTLLNTQKIVRWLPIQIFPSDKIEIQCTLFVIISASKTVLRQKTHLNDSLHLLVAIKFTMHTIISITCCI